MFPLDCFHQATIHLTLAALMALGRSKSCDLIVFEYFVNHADPALPFHCELSIKELIFMHRRRVGVWDEATPAPGLVHSGGADGDAFFRLEGAL